MSRRQYSAMRGGPVKQGACFLAMHAQVQIIPIALIGTHAMNRPATWRPFRHAAVHVAVGEPITPEPLHKDHAARLRQRRDLGRRLLVSYPAMYQQLLKLDGVNDNHDLHPGEVDDPTRVKVDPYAAAGTATKPLRSTATP